MRGMNLFGELSFHVWRLFIIVLYATIGYIEGTYENTRFHFQYIPEVMCDASRFDVFCFSTAWFNPSGLPEVIPTKMDLYEIAHKFLVPIVLRCEE